MLPKIDVPIYELKLLSQKNPVRFRPFLVKEQKLLLMAQEESESENSISLNTIKQILTNCILSEVNVDELPMFDIEYLFLNLRARSMGEIVNLSYRCMKETESEKCNNIVNYDLNILNIKPFVDERHSTKIEINDNLGIIMKYPDLNMINRIDQNDENSIITIILNCIDSIYDSETIYYAKDIPKKELEDFVDSLPTSIVEKIKLFFETMPKIRETLHFKCNKCSHEEDILIEGLDSFFE